MVQWLRLWANDHKADRRRDNMNEGGGLSVPIVAIAFAFAFCILQLPNS